VLVSGTAGSGKSSVAAHFANAACQRGERCLYLAFEESPSQIVRNMRSIGMDLHRWIDGGTLHVVPARPTQLGLERHLSELHRQVDALSPSVVILDPITDFHAIGTQDDIKAMLMRIVDFLKQRGVTAVFTSLVSRREVENPSVSSLIDTWIQLDNDEVRGALRRTIFVRKSRGMSHSSTIRELALGSDGISIADAPDESPGRHGARSADDD
jgi:circadian clock protein KaiC